MQFAVGTSNTFDGDDVRVVRAFHRHKARAHGFAVLNDHTTAAVPSATTIFDTSETQLIAQHIQEFGFRRGSDLNRSTIHDEMINLGHSPYSTFHYIASRSNCKHPRTCVILAAMAAPDYFIPNRDARIFYPLRDLLRAPPLSVAHAYIEALTAPGDLVIDPFGTTPNIARAALALNRRAIVIQSNPLWAWLARTLATLPPPAEITAALTRLGDLPKDDVSLRAHINQLYATPCANCHQLTPADYFVRTREGGVLARHYTCVHCHTTRDDPATEDDLKRAQAIAPRGIHYHFAFARVVPEGGLHAARIHKMLDVYTPRNLAALATITQKIQARFAARERDLLWLLVLHLLERGTMFFATPTAEPQLTRPATFIEFNLWSELERAARALAEEATGALDLADSPRAVVNADASVYIGSGNAKTLARDVPRASATLVLTAPPSRRVTLHALTYLWGAWILGRAAVAGLTPFLDPRKDLAWEWRWYTDSLDEALKTIAYTLRAQSRAVFVFTEAWHPVIEALMLAAARARLHLDTFVFQPRLGDLPRGEFEDIRGEYRLAFTLASEERRRPMDANTLEQQMRAVAFSAASDILARRGEALAFSWVHHAALTRLAREGWLANVFTAPLKTSPRQFVRRALFAGLQDGYAHDFDHHASAEQFVWLRRSNVLDAPLIERVEEAVRAELTRGTRSHEALCDVIYRQFPGDLTPEAGLVELCAEAYAHTPTTEERARVLDALAQLGTRLGYTVTRDFRLAIATSIENQKSPIENFDVVWQSEGTLVYAFVWRARARFIDLAHIHIVPTRGCLLVPDNWVALVREKTRRLPHLTDAFYEAGWNFVRVAAIEQLLARETLERDDVITIIGLEPPILQRGAQLGLF
jgi:hypothetical protein